MQQIRLHTVDTSVVQPGFTFGKSLLQKDPKGTYADGISTCEQLDKYILFLLMLLLDLTCFIKFISVRLVEGAYSYKMYFVLDRCLTVRQTVI